MKNLINHWVSLTIIASGLLFSGVVFATIISGNFSTASSSQVTVTQLNIATPTLNSGDLMLASLAVNGGNSAVVIAPSGWTLISRVDNDSNIALLSYWKTAGNSEPSSYLWQINGQTTAEGGIVAYRGGLSSSNQIDVVGTNTGFGTTATTSSVTTSTGNELVISIFAADVGKSTNATNYFTPATGMTEKYDVSNIPFGPSMALDEMLQTSATSTGIKSSTISGSKGRNWATQIIAIKTPTSNPLTVDANTAALWNFNGTVGSTAKKTDSGPNSLNLTEINGPLSTDGQTTPLQDGAYLLNGINQYLTSPDAGLPSGNSPYTIEAWVKIPAYPPTNNTEHYSLMTWGTRADFQTVSVGILGVGGIPNCPQGAIKWGSYNENNCSKDPVAVGVWQYIAVTYDGANINFYLNGNPDGSVPVENTPNIVLSGTSYIGVVNDGTHEFFNGSIDQLKISNVAKTASEIYNYYNGI